MKNPLDWFKQKKEVAEIEKALEQAERQEVIHCKNAINQFTHILERTYYTSRIQGANENIAINSRNDHKEMELILDFINKTKGELSNIKPYSQRVIDLVRRMEKVLLVIRNITGNKRIDVLNNDEIRIIDFSKRITIEINILTRLLNELTQKELEQIVNMGYCDPRNPAKAREIRRKFTAIKQGLETMLKNLQDIDQLERNVKQQSAAYLAAA